MGGWGRFCSFELDGSRREKAASIQVPSRGLNPRQVFRLLGWGFLNPTAFLSSPSQEGGSSPRFLSGQAAWSPPFTETIPITAAGAARDFHPIPFTPRIARLGEDPWPSSHIGVI